MTIRTIVLFIILNSGLANVLLPEDGMLNFTQLSLKYGHKAEEHVVVTADGYILTIFRLPGKLPPVLLLHGFLDSADSFVLRGNGSLAINLANKGYDVWAGNTRGNRYSRKHVKLNPDTDSSFWNYSFHEHGYYDLAAITDYVLNSTGEKSLRSVGHSEGTTDHFILGSLRPEYNNKFKILIALAPSAYLRHLSPLMKLVSEMGPLINRMSVQFRIEELFSDNSLERDLLEDVCSRQQSLCGELLCRTGGYNPKRIEKEFLSIIFGHFPTSCSRKSLNHYNQLAINKRFALFDYGAKDNLKLYRQTAPPDYNLTQVTMKTVFFVGRNDLLAATRDVKTLRGLLPKVVHYHMMEPKTWNHFDFIWGNDMPETLFPHIFSMLEKYL